MKNLKKLLFVAFALAVFGGAILAFGGTGHFFARLNSQLAPTKNLDSDGDCLPDFFEIFLGTNLRERDSDGDGYSDFQEFSDGSNPLSSKSVPEVFPPTLEEDCSDIRIDSGKNFFDRDADQDGLTNGEELKYGTNLGNADTDGDGYLDGHEVAEGTDPLNPRSFPKE